MAKPEGVTCEICLRPDESEWMLRITIEHAAHNPFRLATICRDCGMVIAREVKLAFDNDTLELIPNDDKSTP